MQSTKSLKTTHGFSLLELAIVIAVISSLLVGFMVSTEIVAAAKQASVIRKLQAINKGISRFIVEIGTRPVDFATTTCNQVAQLKSFPGFCSADFMEAGEQNRAYRITKMLSLTGYIDPMPDYVLPSSPSFRRTTDINIKEINGFEAKYKKLFVEADAVNDADPFAYILEMTKHLPPKFNSNSVYLVGSLYNNVLATYNGMYRGKLVNGGDSTDAFPIQNMINISILAFDDNEGFMTSEEMYNLDVKIDDGSPVSGKIWGAANGYGFSDADGVHPSNTNRFVSTGKAYFPQDYACVDYAFSTINSTVYLQETTAKYTVISDKAEVTDVIKKRARKDKTAGCNLFYITNEKTSDGAVDLAADISSQ